MVWTGRFHVGRSPIEWDVANGHIPLWIPVLKTRSYIEHRNEAGARYGKGRSLGKAALGNRRAPG